MKGKILCPAGCQNPATRITEAKEILKNPRPAGSWRPLKCIFSGKEKRPPTAGRNLCSVRSMYKRTRQGAICGSYRASFYHGAKIRNSAVLPLAGNLLGSAFPKPCFAPLRAKKTENSFCYFPKSSAMKGIERFLRPKCKKVAQ